MTERKYSLSEIDRMREAIREKDKPDFSQFWIGPDGPEPRYFQVRQRWIDEAEQELRTAMIGGVDPAEFHS